MEYMYISGVKRELHMYESILLLLLESYSLYLHLQVVVICTIITAWKKRKWDYTFTARMLDTSFEEEGCGQDASLERLHCSVHVQFTSL